MIPSEKGSSAPASSKSLLQEHRDDQPAALVDLRALERLRQELQLREGHVLVDALEDAVYVGTRLDEVGSQPERLRRRVLILEPPRVGHDRDVQGLGDRRA